MNHSPRASSGASSARTPHQGGNRTAPSPFGAVLLRPIRHCLSPAFREYLHAVHELQARVERLEGEIHAMATESRQAPVIPALQALKGVQEVTAVTLVAEIGEFSRALEALVLKAQERLDRKYWRLLSRGKRLTDAATAVARECEGGQPGL